MKRHEQRIQAMKDEARSKQKLEMTKDIREKAIFDHLMELSLKKSEMDDDIPVGRNQDLG